MNEHEHRDREGQADPAEARGFGSYTPADHARVAMADAAWKALETAVAATAPEAYRASRPGLLIETAQWLTGYAQSVLRAAVIATHEQGQSWEQIGQALGVSRQAAHERFAGVVTEFRTQLAAHLAALETNPHATPGPGRLVDTPRRAPLLDRWLTELGAVPGTLTEAGKPGQLLALLSNPASAAAGSVSTVARDPEQEAPDCRYTTTVTGPEAEPAARLRCLLTEGHPGDHRLVVVDPDH